MQDKILFIDDEPRVLEGFQRLLHPTFRIETATSGEEALRKLKSSRQFAVAVCDMRMPKMDGVELLYKIRLQFPEVVRIMLTGNSDQQTAIQAVNEGNIFRFLTKPCDKDALTKALNAALVQFRMANNNEALLEKASYGQRLAPWTMDPTSAGFRAVEEKVLELVSVEARTFQPSEGGIYLGKTLWVGLGYVVQFLSPTRVIVHSKNSLTRIPREGDFVRIEYNNDRGEVTEIGG